MKTKKINIRKLMAVLSIFAVAFLLMPVNASAAKKPGKVRGIEEVKVADKSITVKFKKAARAKSYQIRVYEATLKLTKTSGSDGEKKSSYKWAAEKKLVEQTETNKPEITTKVTGDNKNFCCYAIKIRACNGNVYGKWNTQYVCATFKGTHYIKVSYANIEE